MGLIQKISLEVEAASLSKLEQDMKAAGARGGTALEQEFAVKMADLRSDMAAGLMDESEFRAKAARAGAAYNQEITKQMDVLKAKADGLRQTMVAAGPWSAIMDKTKFDALQTELDQTEKEYAQLGTQIKATGAASVEQATVMSTVWGKFKEFVAGLGQALAAAFSVREIINFGKESIKAAEESDRAWRDLAQSVESVGGNFERMRPGIEKALEVIGKRTIQDTDDLAESFSALIDSTGNYGDALRATSIAADLAAKSGKPLAEATDAVAKALISGNTKGLIPFHLQLDKTKDLLPQLEEQLKNVSERMTPWERQTGTMAIAWNNFQEAIGRALTSVADGGTAFDALTTAITDLTKWVEENKGEISEWVKTFVSFMSVGLKQLTELVRGTKRDIEGLWLFWTLLKTDAIKAWNGLIIALDQGAQQILQIFARLSDGIATVFEHIPGLGKAAANLRKDAEEMRQNISKLGVDIVAKSQDTAKRQIEAEDAVKKFRGEAAHFYISSTQGYQQVAEDSIDTLETKHKESNKKTTKDHKDNIDKQTEAERQHVRDLAAMYDHAYGAGGAIPMSLLAGTEAVKKFYGDWEKAAAQSTAELQNLSKITMASYVEDQTIATNDLLKGQGKQQEELHKTRDAVKEVSDALTDGSRTYNTETVPAIQRGSQDIDRSLDDQAKAADGVKESFRGGEQYYTDTAVPNILAGMAGLTTEQKKQAKEVEKSSKENSDSVKTNWLDSLNVISGAMQGLGGVFGGVFKNIATMTTSIVGGIGSIASGIKGIASGANDFLGILGKIGASAGVIGAAIGIATTVVGAIGGLIHRDKDPGRMKTNNEMFDKAMAGDQEALRFLYKMSGRQSADEGWATDAAREDAWERYQIALKNNPALAPIGSNTANLRETGGQASTGEGATGTATASPGGSVVNSTAPPPPPSGGKVPTRGLGFALGGIMPYDGMASLHAGELIVPPHLTDALLKVAGQQPSITRSTTVNNAGSAVSLELHVHSLDRDIPRTVVDAISHHLAIAYGERASLAGNAGLPLD